MEFIVFSVILDICGAVMSLQLTNDEKLFLLSLARKSIKQHLNNDEPEDVPFFSETLKKSAGLFVTLHIDSELRGCIGYVEGYKKIQDAVRDLAISAAFNDPRFPPVDMTELDQIDIEISVLTPLEKVKDPTEIKVGRDGLIVKQSPHQGLLLPQVAVEYKWDVSEFLDYTCKKAGLPSSAWQDDRTEIYRFEAIIFGEKETELN